MKNPLVTEAIWSGRDVSVVVVGKELDVGALKANLRRINQAIHFGGSRIVSEGLELVIRIPPSGVEGIRINTVSALDQCSLDVQLQPQPHHETHDPPK